MTELNAWSASDLLAMPPSEAYLDRLDLAEELTIAARELDAPPKYECGNPVHVRGSPHRANLLARAPMVCHTVRR